MAQLNRRQLLGASAGTLALGLPSIIQAATNSNNAFTAARMWPAQAYTRITLESPSKVKFKSFTLEKPHRLVVDIEDIALNDVVANLGKKVQKSDPYVSNIRVGQKDSKTLRIVLDLKVPTLPQVFLLNPVANFKHRMVIDIYPAFAAEDDPILALLNGRNKSKAIESANKNTQEKAQAQTPPTNTPTEKSNDTFKQKRRPVIMVDAGHGGEDPGAISPQGLKEKDVVLLIARLTKTKLESLGYIVKMTRNEDVFIPLKSRTLKAQQERADLFISIHADSAPNPNARGTGVYVLSQKGATDEASRLLAESQNDADMIGGIQMSSSKDVNSVLMNMMQNQTISDSLRLGRLILNQLGKYNKVRNEVNQANFVVLRTPDIPSILVESAFLSNTEDEALLRSDAYRQQVAQAIADGVKQYLNIAVLARR